MKKSNIIFTLSILTLCVSFRGANAAPCTAVDGTLFNGTFNVSHSVMSTKKPLKTMTVFETPLAAQSKRMLGDGAPFTLHHLFDVNEMQFESGATENQIRILQTIKQVAFVSQPSSPDLCFLVWVTSDNQLADSNVILGQNGEGEMNLGSYNKLDPNLYMTLTRQSGARKR